MSTPNKTTHEILIAARKRIEKPENWTKGTAARSKDGFCIWERSPKACQFCAAGAVHAQGLEETQKRPVFDLLRQIIGGAYVTDWNDAPERTHAEVLAAFDRAIAATAPTEG